MKRETLPILDVTYDHEWHMARDPKHPDAKDRRGGAVVIRERKMGLKRLAQGLWDAEIWNKRPIPTKGVRTIFCKFHSFAPLRPLREVPFLFLGLMQDHIG